ncbi:hypothetical protein WJX77_010624 [Trebouxia sp. C0004]
MFAHADFLEQPSEWLEGRADKCLHIKALEVLCRWQHTCLMDLATRQPAEDLKAEGSCDTVLVQSVSVQEQLQGASAAVALGDNIDGLPGTAHAKVPSVTSHQGAAASLPSKSSK